MGFGNKDQGPKKPRSLYSVKASWTDNIDWNTTMYIIWCILVLSLVFLGSNHFKYEKELRVANQTQLVWSQKADRAQAKINHGIIVPSKKAGNLTPQEGKTVKFLTDLFTDCSTYTSSQEYAQARRDAKQVVSDPQFFKVFFPSDKTADGHLEDIIDTKSIVHDVEVFPMGGTHYLVVLSATPYHDSSDLYQQKKLISNNYVFDVSSTATNVQRCTPLTDFSGMFNNQKD